METDLGYLPRLSSREDYVDFLEGYALPTVDELEEQKSTRKLVKTYMLETVAHGVTMPELEKIFPRRVRLHRIDDSLFRVHDAHHRDRVIGLIETLDDRHPVLYTTVAAQESDKWVRHVVDTNPWLDRLWLSSTILFELWQYVQRTIPAHRYVRLGFEHEAWYESPLDFATAEASDAEESPLGGEDKEEDEAGSALVERRRSKVQLTERLGILKLRLPQLVQLYDPLHSLVQLQIPSGSRGGHLLHFDGKVTNRSDSFVEHRATVALVLGLYRRVTEHAERRLWVDTSDVGGDGFRVNGAPMLLRFQERLTEPTFNRFVDLGLQRKTSRFRIGGYATRRGPTKVHLAAIDRHLWQPFLLEATDRSLLAVLPRGTCGNTVHRMVTNVQRFLGPNIEVWLGSERYDHAVANSLAAAA